MILFRHFKNDYFSNESQLKWLKVFELNYFRLQGVPLSYWQFIIKLILILCLSFSLARLFWLVFPVPVIKDAVVQTKSLPFNEIGPASDTPHIDIEQLKSLNLFGKSEGIKAAPGVPVVDIQASETHLSLTLMGVVVGNFEQMARAIISVNNKQDLYAIGAVLPEGEGVTLEKVLTDRIIINNNGQFESLYLDGNDGNDGNDVKHKQPANIAPLVSREESQKMLEWQADHAEPEVPPARYRPAVSLPDQAITAMERTMSNVVNMNTFNEGGKLAGFKISPGRDVEKFKELGLQANDVITAINGWPMSDPAKILDMYQNLGDSGSASVQIRRGTSVITVEVALQ